MKKTLCFAAFLSTVAAPVMADPVEWKYTIDTTLDGNVVNEFQATLQGTIHSNQFHLVNKDTPDDGNIIGKIEPTAVTEIGSGTAPRLTMTFSNASETVYYLGRKTDENQYQGVWYGANNTSGDFLLEPTTVNADPTTKQTIVAVTPSSEGYGAAYGAPKAIDGIFGNNSTNVWFSGVNDTAPSLTLDMGASINITHYQLSRGYCASANGWMAVTWTVEGSNDNSNWTTIDTVLDDQSANYPSATACTQFGPMEQIDVPDNYRYYKITFTSTTLDTIAGVSIGEIELWN